MNILAFIMGAHHLTLRVTSSGLEDENLIADAISLLIGDSELVELEKTNSYHGSSIFLISATTRKNKVALSTISKLGLKNLEDLQSTIEQRLDENNTLHFRIGLDELIDGEVIIVKPNRKSIKCQLKLEVYPGQSVTEQTNLFLQEAIFISN